MKLSNEQEAALMSAVLDFALGLGSAAIPAIQAKLRTMGEAPAWEIAELVEKRRKLRTIPTEELLRPPAGTTTFSSPDLGEGEG